MRKPVYLRSKFETATDAKNRDQKIARLAKQMKTSWSGAVRHIIDSFIETK